MPTGEEESSKIDSKPKPVDEDDSDDENEQIYFTEYNADSYTKQLENEKKAKEKAEANLKNQGEAHLVDGELRFDSEEDHGPAKKRNPDLIEGNTLPEDCGMPKELYGKPLEEIDKLITDKVSFWQYFNISVHFHILSDLFVYTRSRDSNFQLQGPVVQS